MAAATQALPTETKRHLSVVQPDGRAGFGALRAELHARTEDKDLAELWADLKLAERKAVAGSAGMEAKDALRSIESMGKHDRDAIRAAIGRMSRYAQRLRQQLETSAQPSCQMARNARQALLEDDRQAALHWLNLIEQAAQ